MKNKPILCLDFDGVIHSYWSGWHGANIIEDPPVKGAFEAIEEYAQYFDVHIFSSRSRQEGGIEAMKSWFQAFGFPCDISGDPKWLKFPEEKPPATVSIDDRAITFTGVFPDLETLQNFKPWNKKEV